MDDEEIIKLFLARSEQAIKELDLKYGKMLHRLSYNIVNDLEDAKECVNDTYLSTWNTIPPVEPNPLLAYVCKIVRNISLKLYERKTAAKRNSFYDVALQELEDSLFAPDNVEAEIEGKELALIIENFLDTLSIENRALFLRRYWFLDSYACIAQRTGLSEKNVSVRLARIRKQLRKYLFERGVFI